MADDLTQRMMDSAAQANDDVAARPFYATETASNSIDKAIDPARFAQSGSQLHDNLMRRAQQKAPLDATIGQQPQFRSYQNSKIGSIGMQADTRRELTLMRQEERQRREDRFGDRIPGRIAERKRRTLGASAPPEDTTDQENTSRRQEKNAYHSDQARSGPSFREPSSRNYNPYG